MFFYWCLKNNVFVMIFWSYLSNHYFENQCYKNWFISIMISYHNISSKNKSFRAGDPLRGTICICYVKWNIFCARNNLNMMRYHNADESKYAQCRFGVRSQQIETMFNFEIEKPKALNQMHWMQIQMLMLNARSTKLYLAKKGFP